MIRHADGGEASCYTRTVCVRVTILIVLTVCVCVSSTLKVSRDVWVELMMLCRRRAARQVCLTWGPQEDQLS